MMEDCFFVIVMIAAVVGAVVWLGHLSRVSWRRAHPALFTSERLDEARESLLALSDERISNIVITSVEQLLVAIEDFERRSGWRKPRAGGESALQ